MFVIDTNVMSAGDPLKRGLSDSQKERLSRSDVFIPAPVVTEIRVGLLRLERLGAHAKLRVLAPWWERVERAFSRRILPFDHHAANQAAILADRADAAGHDPGWVDIQIAAIAEARGFTVLTRNVRHFAPLGTAHLNPFVDELPG